MPYGEGTFINPTLIANPTVADTDFVSATTTGTGEAQFGLIVDFPVENHQVTSGGTNRGDTNMFSSGVPDTATTLHVRIQKSGEIGESEFAYGLAAGSVIQGMHGQGYLSPPIRYIDVAAQAGNKVITYSGSPTHVKPCGGIETADGDVLFVFRNYGGSADGKVFSSVWDGSDWGTVVSVYGSAVSTDSVSPVCKITDGTVLVAVKISSTEIQVREYDSTVPSWSDVSSINIEGFSGSFRLGGMASNSFDTVVLGLATYGTGATPERTPYVVTSSDAGVSWSNLIPLMDYGGEPDVALKKDGNFLAAWSDNYNPEAGLESSDIIAKESRTGLTWSLLQTEDGLGSVMSDYFVPTSSLSPAANKLKYNYPPRLCVAEDGLIFCVAPFESGTSSWADGTQALPREGIAVSVSKNADGSSWNYAVPSGKHNSGDFLSNMYDGWDAGGVPAFFSLRNELILASHPDETLSLNALPHLMFQRMRFWQTRTWTEPYMFFFNAELNLLPSVFDGNVWQKSGDGATSIDANDYLIIPVGTSGTSYSFHAGLTQVLMGPNSTDEDYLDAGFLGAKAHFVLTAPGSTNTPQVEITLFESSTKNMKNSIAFEGGIGTCDIVIYDDASVGTSVGLMSNNGDREVVILMGKLSQGSDTVYTHIFWRPVGVSTWSDTTVYTRDMGSNGHTSSDIRFGCELGTSSWKYFCCGFLEPQNTWEGLSQLGYTPDESRNSSGSSTGATDRSFRVLIKGGQIKKSGKKIRIKVHNTRTIAGDVVIDRIFVAEQEVGVYLNNIVKGTQKQLFFNGVASKTLAYTAFCWTDWLDFDLDEDKSYMVSFASASAVPFKDNEAGSTTTRTSWARNVSASGVVYVDVADWDDTDDLSGSARFGNIGYIAEIQCCVESGMERNMLDTFSASEKLKGAPTSSYPQTLQNGILVYFEGQNAAKADQWSVPTKYLYSGKNLLSGARSKYWRSQFDGAGGSSQIVLVYNVQATVTSPPSNQPRTTLINSIGLIGTNFKDCLIKNQADATIATLSALIQTGAITSGVTGDVRIGSATTFGSDRRHVGKFVMIEDSGAGTSEVFKVVDHTNLVLTFDGKITVTTPDTYYIFSDRMFDESFSSAQTPDQIKIVIGSSQRTYDGFFKIEKAIWGNALQLTQRRDRGFALNIVSQVEVSRTRTGAMFAGKRGEEYRVTELSFLYSSSAQQRELDHFFQYIDFGKFPFFFLEETGHPDDLILYRLGSDRISKTHVVGGDVYNVDTFELVEEV